MISPDGAYGGPARVALNQSAELVRRGHEVTVVAAGRGYREMPTALNGVTVKLFTAKTVLPGTGFSGVAAPGLAKWLRDNWSRFGVTHIHLGRDLVVLPVALAARRRRIPYVVQTHGMVVPSRRRLARPLDRFCTRKALRDARAVLYLNIDERAQLTAVAGPDLRLVELGNGVPHYPVGHPAPGRPEVLFAARMHPRKRPVAFVEMAKTLLDAGVDARFALVGHDEGEGPAVRAALAGDPNIVWEGPLNPDAVPARMAAARVYVLPSVREPQPMSVLEAMAVGRPVVVTKDCGLASMIEQSGSGIVTDPAVPALVAAVDRILRNDGAAQSMGERGRRTAHSEYGMEIVGDRLIETYRQVAGVVR